MSAQTSHDEQPEPRRRPSPLGSRAPADESVAAAIARRRTSGFVGDFVIEPDSIPPGVLCRGCGHRHLARRLHVLAAARFSGGTSAESDWLVITMTCPRCETDGLLISACGRAVSGGENALLADIVSRAHPRHRARHRDVAGSASASPLRRSGPRDAVAVLVVDAANVIGSQPNGWWRDRAGATRRLTEHLRATVRSGRIDAPVTLVVEGRARAGAAEGDVDGVEVVHAPGVGDDTIAAIATRHRGAIVVTADRGLAARVRESDAKVVGPSWLLDQLLE